MSSAEFKGKTGLVRLWNALGYSRDGLAAAWKNEAAFREEVLLAAIAIPLALFLGKTGVDRSILIGSIILILIVEILNSAIEAHHRKNTNWPSAPRTWAALPCYSACSMPPSSGPAFSGPSANPSFVPQAGRWIA